MKEAFENDSVDLEQLLRTKTWNRLSEAERAEVSAVLSGQGEYERMYAMVHELKTSSGVHDEDLVPSPGLRENLLLAFEDEQKKRRAMWWSGWWFRLSGSLRFDIPAVRISLAVLLLVGGVFTVIKLMNNDNAAPIAKKENIQPTTGTPEEIVPSGNNITVTPEPKEHTMQPLPQNAVPQDDNIQVVPAAVNNGMQTVDGNISPLTDTGANRFAMNPVDTNTLAVAPLATFTNGTNAVCCGSATNVTATGGTVYNWTPTSNGTVMTNGTYNNNVVGVVTVNGLPPRARALSNDAQVLDVFFAMK